MIVLEYVTAKFVPKRFGNRFGNGFAAQQLVKVHVGETRNLLLLW